MNKLISQLKADQTLQLSTHFNGIGFTASIIPYIIPSRERIWQEAGHGHTPEEAIREAFAIFNGECTYSAHPMSEFKI